MSPLPPTRTARRLVWVGLGCAASGLVAGILLGQVYKVREAAARAQWSLSQLALAFHYYADVHGTLPPAVVYGEDGTPLHSWRVLILPYVEEKGLHDEFRLTEPWDSPHNLRLLERMPRLYAPPWRKDEVPPHHTVCHVFVGPGTPFERGKALTFDAAGFPDGTSNTLLFVEAGEPVPWTKPEEIEYAPERPLRLRGLFRDGFRAAWADGSRRFVPYDADEAALRAAVTRNGGEPMGEW
jgi:hypothetical protein